MVNQWVLKILLFPLALLYGLGVLLFDFFYRIGLLRGVRFSIPVISVGNLSVGGTGKSPHIEYLVRLLHENIHLAIVSRGYKRKTTGFLEVQLRDDASRTGDEPLQFKRKFPGVPVAVGESRSLAIPQLIRLYPHLQAILMDDGFQHREVVPGLNILLTEYNALYTRDFILPVGRLREWPYGAVRADMIIVTKCPDLLSEGEKNDIRNEVRRRTTQQVFFSKYIYGHPYKMYGQGERIALTQELSVLVVVAIAGTEYLMEYVESRAGDVRIVEYTDHHPFSSFDIGNIERHFKALPADRPSIILTTEKDAMRLDTHRQLLLQLNLPIYILPVAVQFIDEPAHAFDEAIKTWLLNFKR